jgi:hypothetical protein
MRLHGKMPATAKCRLRLNAGAKLRNFLLPQLLEAVHDKNLMMFEYVRNGAMLGRSTQWWRGAWDKCPMVARCFEFALDGWRCDALMSLPMAGGAMLGLRLMAVQCFGAAPNGGPMLDVMPNGWWCKA